MKTMLAAVASIILISTSTVHAEWMLWIDEGSGLKPRAVARTREECFAVANNSVHPWNVSPALVAGCSEVVPYHVIQVTDGKTGKVVQIAR